jgi:cytochrome c oxidase cbb3-type subunit 3
MSSRRLVAWGCTAALLASSCHREKRQLKVDTIGQQRALPSRPLDLFARPASGEVKPAPPRSAYRPYEGNALSISEGQRLYGWYNCAGCHAGGGGGGMGPPLIDHEWRYGSEPEQIYATITEGRPLGMPTFGRYMPDDQVWKLVAYVRSMSGLERMDAVSARRDHMQDVEKKEK